LAELSKVRCERVRANFTLDDSTVKEGFGIFIDVHFSGAAILLRNTRFYWVNRGTTVASDFDDGYTSGSFLPYADGSPGTAITLPLSYNVDFSNGNPTVIIEIRSESVTGPLLGTSPVVTVVDRISGGGTPTFTITTDKQSYNEGDMVYVTVTTTNVDDGEEYYIAMAEPRWMTIHDPRRLGDVQFEVRPYNTGATGPNGYPIVVNGIMRYNFKVRIDNKTEVEKLFVITVRSMTEEDMAETGLLYLLANNT
jgi:hypothetical protein